MWKSLGTHCNLGLSKSAAIHYFGHCLLTTHSSLAGYNASLSIQSICYVWCLSFQAVTAVPSVLGLLCFHSSIHESLRLVIRLNLFPQSLLLLFCCGQFYLKSASLARYSTRSPIKRNIFFGAEFPAEFPADLLRRRWRLFRLAALLHVVADLLLCRLAFHDSPL